MEKQPTYLNVCNRNYTPLGKFENTSGHMVISDPSYYKSPWHNQAHVSSLPGWWKASVWMGPVGSQTIKVHRLHAHHVDDETCLYCSRGTSIKIERMEDSMGVDSGMLGFFDAALYDGKCQLRIEEAITKPIYAVLDTHMARVINKGCMSYSGHGDGRYGGFIFKESKNDRVIGVEVMFIDDAGDKLDDKLDHILL